MSEAGITDWKSEWYELRSQMECKEAKHREEVDALKRKIAELERRCGMKEFVEKLIERLEEEKEKYKQARANTHCVITETSECDSCRADHYLYARLNCVDKSIEIVNQLAEEYKEQSSQDLMIVESLPSLYPMQPFEEESLGRVVGSAKHSGGWIPCSERLPDKYCHCLVTRRNDYEDGSFDSDVREDVWIELEGVWGWQSKFEGLIDDVIAWQPLPLPYKSNGINEA